MPLNVRALAVDVADDDNIFIDVGVAQYGIEVLRMSRSTFTGAWGLTFAAPRIETPGNVHDIAIRKVEGHDKVLLVADGPAGLRIYGEVP